MKTSRWLVRLITRDAALLLALGGARFALGDTAVFRPDNSKAIPKQVVTNWIPRQLTNVIEVNIPTNLFVDLFQTNWLLQVTTNVVPVFRTNRIEKLLTNVVEVYHTNLLTRFTTNTVQVPKTNWVEQFATNTVNVYRTNLQSRTLTNTVTVELTKTNIVPAYRTNLTTLTMTNWQTVLVMKTNWVTQLLTNVVEVELPAPQPRAASAPSEEKVPQSPPSTTTTAADGAEDYVFELTKTDRPASGKEVEIQIALKSSKDAAAILPAQDWRLEATDGTFLAVGQRAEFHTELLPGKYTITTKFRRDEQSPFVRLRGAITVTKDGAPHQSPASVVGLAK